MLLHCTQKFLKSVLHLLWCTLEVTDLSPVRSTVNHGFDRRSRRIWMVSSPPFDDTSVSHRIHKVGLPDPIPDVPPVFSQFIHTNPRTEPKGHNPRSPKSPSIIVFHL